MALGNPVVKLSDGGQFRESRGMDLAVIVVLAVAVVVVAAVWGTTSKPDDGVVIESTPALLPEQATGAEVAITATATSPSASVGVTEGSEAPSIIGSTFSPPGLVRPILPQALERYQVQRGESLEAIASVWGVSVSELLDWNRHLEADSTLIRGEWLWIPQWVLSTVGDSAGQADDGKSGRGGG